MGGGFPILVALLLLFITHDVAAQSASNASAPAPATATATATAAVSAALNASEDAHSTVLRLSQAFKGLAPSESYTVGLCLRNLGDVTYQMRNCQKVLPLIRRSKDKAETLLKDVIVWAESAFAANKYCIDGIDQGIQNATLRAEIRPAVSHCEKLTTNAVDLINGLRLS